MLVAQQEIIVVGGGVVGLSAALAMQHCGFKVHVLDAGSLLSENESTANNRVYALNYSSQKLLTTLGVWQFIDVVGCAPYRNMHVWTAGSKAAIDFDARTIAQAQLGFIVSESALKNALLQRITALDDIVLHAHTSVDAIKSSLENIAVFSGAQVFSAQGVLIADGALSPARQSLGVALHEWSYNHSAIIATISTEKKHQQTAYQVFHAEGPLALLPLNNTNTCSIVWSLPPEKAKANMALSEAEFNEALSSAFFHKLGALKLLSARHMIPLHMRHTKQYAGARWVLLGDAAHTVHPMAGLGLNVGLADVASWMKIAQEHPDNLWHTRHTARYQRQRKHAVWQIIAMLEGLKFIFSKNNGPLAWLRDQGLKLCDNLAPLKRFFIAQAAGE